MFSEQDKTAILKLKSNLASYYSLQMKKLGDRTLESLFYSNCVISGGSISSIYHNEAVADIDLYATSSQGLNKVKEYILNGNKNVKMIDSYELDSDGKEVTTGKTQPLVTLNAVTLTNDVQFVYMDTWQNCKRKFDFVHCLPHYDLATQRLYISESQFQAIKTKTLVPTGYVEVKDKRRGKYFNRGWKEESKSVEFRWSDSPITIGIVAQEISQIIPTVV